jgi:hypothetical protein
MTIFTEISEITKNGQLFQPLIEKVDGLNRQVLAILGEDEKDCEQDASIVTVVENCKLKTFYQKKMVLVQEKMVLKVSIIYTASILRFLFILTASYREFLQSKNLTASCPSTDESLILGFKVLDQKSV